MTNKKKANELIHTWNPDISSRLKNIMIEEDIRDALQCIRTKLPSLEQRKNLLELSSKIGIEFGFLGFPASSTQEFKLCAELAAHTCKLSGRLKPVFMCRAIENDIDSVLKIRDISDSEVYADIFISTSALRSRVEGWSRDEVTNKLCKAAQRALDNKLPFRISLEDSTRTSQVDLSSIIQKIAVLGPEVINLCDTVGDCTPRGAAAHTSFVLECLRDIGVNIAIGWHGHNDKGLGLANALASAEAGASILSGTFMGVGERSGNFALEQLLVVLADAGNTRFDLKLLQPLCELFASSTGLDIPFNSPIIGADAFSTSTGTHAAAIIKARKIGKEYEDVLYSSVSAAKLGRNQKLLIGPNSGRSVIRAALKESAINVTNEKIVKVLAFCKKMNKCTANKEEIRKIVTEVSCNL